MCVPSHAKRRCLKNKKKRGGREGGREKEEGKRVRETEKEGAGGGKIV